MTNRVRLHASENFHCPECGTDLQPIISQSTIGCPTHGSVDACGPCAVAQLIDQMELPTVDQLELQQRVVYEQAHRETGFHLGFEHNAVSLRHVLTIGKLIEMGDINRAQMLLRLVTASYSYRAVSMMLQYGAATMAHSPEQMQKRRAEEEFELMGGMDGVTKKEQTH